LPVYGKGENVRDWLFVDDHVEALLLVIEKGGVGQCYNVGGSSERRNIDVVNMICDLVDEMAFEAGQSSRRGLITYVDDRPGHDLRYAIDCSKIQAELNWRPRESFESGLRKTVRWYLDNRSWWQAIRTGAYQGQRLGIAV
jgi:dTDP-glucose 4,6-dehydratase